MLVSFHNECDLTSHFSSVTRVKTGWFVDQAMGEIERVPPLEEKDISTFGVKSVLVAVSQMHEMVNLLTHDKTCRTTKSANCHCHGTVCSISTSVAWE